MTLTKKALENTVGNGENAGNQHFLLFPQCFLLYQREQLSFLAVFNFSYANGFNLVTTKTLSFGKGFTELLTTGQKCWTHPYMKPLQKAVIMLLNPNLLPCSYDPDLVGN